MNQIAPCVFKNEVIINLTIFLFKYKRLLSSYSKFCVAYLHISLNVFVNRFQTLDYQICWRKTYQGILKSAWFCYNFIKLYGNSAWGAYKQYDTLYGSYDKIGYVFPMVVVSILLRAEFGPNDPHKDAPHFIKHNKF